MSRALLSLRDTVLYLPSSDTKPISNIQSAFKVGGSQTPFCNHCFCWLLLTPTYCCKSKHVRKCWYNTHFQTLYHQRLLLPPYNTTLRCCCLLSDLKKEHMLHALPLGASVLLVITATELLAQCWGRRKGTLNFLQQEAHAANANSLANTEYFWSRAELTCRCGYIHFPSRLCSLIYHS